MNRSRLAFASFVSCHESNPTFRPVPDRYARETLSEMNAFRQFVEDNARWFRGHAPETNESLDAAEKSLGVQLPDDIRWILRNCGYWHATGISSLDETIANTNAAREHLNLPKRFIVLYDHHDGGVILLDTIADFHTGERKVYSVSWELVPDQIAEDIVYGSYMAYVRGVLERQRSFIADSDIDYIRCCNKAQYSRTTSCG